MNNLPNELTQNLSDTEVAAVSVWWSSLSQTQRSAVQHLLAMPDCTLYASDPDDPIASSAVDFFADDWESNWKDNWESDWREYLTEHADVRLVTLEFLCYTIRYGQ